MRLMNVRRALGRERILQNNQWAPPSARSDVITVHLTKQRAIYHWQLMSADSPTEIHALFRNAINLGDVEALISLYEPHAIVIIREGIALLHGKWVVQRTTTRESQLTTRGMSTEVVRKQPNGTPDNEQ